MNEKLSISQHFTELRNRLLICVGAFLLLFVLSFYYASEIFNILVYPLKYIWQDNNSRKMIYTALHEKFFTEVKVAAFGSLMVIFPLIVSQIWLFITPGLYKKEKRVVLPFLIATPIMFYLGAAFVYFFLLPVAWDFFLSFEQTSNDFDLAIILEPKVGEYLNLTLGLIIAFGFCFELPVLLILLIRVGLLEVETLVKSRKYAILLSFIVAAILTPPDPISQFSLAIPLIILYELSIYTGRYISKPSKFKTKSKKK